VILKKFPFWVAAPVATWAIFVAYYSMFPVPRTPVPVHGSGRESWCPDGDDLDGEGTGLSG
jgi:hypothetical protein